MALTRYLVGFWSGRQVADPGHGNTTSQVRQSDPRPHQLFDMHIRLCRLFDRCGCCDGSHGSRKGAGRKFGNCEDASRFPTGLIKSKRTASVSSELTDGTFSQDTVTSVTMCGKCHRCQPIFREIRALYGSRGLPSDKCIRAQQRQGGGQLRVRVLWHGRMQGAVLPDDARGSWKGARDVNDTLFRRTAFVFSRCRVDGVVRWVTKDRAASSISPVMASFWFHRDRADEP
jgi:hypothetical protein